MAVLSPIIEGMSLFEPLLIAEHQIGAPTATEGLAEEFGEFGLGQGVLDEGVLVYGMFLRGRVLNAGPAGSDNLVEIALAFNPDTVSPADQNAMRDLRGIFAHIAIRTELTVSGMTALAGPAYRWEPPEAVLIRRNPAVINFQNIGVTQDALVVVYYKRVTLRRDTFNALVTRT